MSPDPHPEKETTMPTRTDYRDAIGWLSLSLHRDWDSRNDLARLVDPAGLVDALTDMLLGLAHISTDGEPERYVDYMRANIDAMLSRRGVDEE